MNKFFAIINFLFNSTILLCQTPVGNYVPSSNNALPKLFHPISKHELLQINPDSTYHYEILWESFLDGESGIWRMFGDSLFTYKTSPTESKRFSAYFYMYASKNDSFPNKNRITVTDTRGATISNLRFKAYIDSIIVDANFNENGAYILDYSRFDTLFIFGNKYNLFDFIRVSSECCFKNDYTIVLNQRSFIVRKNRLQNLSRKTIFRKE